jgi:hypothetical protein
MEDDEALLDEGDEEGDGGGDEGEEVLEEEEDSQDGEEDVGEIDGEYVVQYVAADEAGGAALAEGDGSDPAAAPAAGPALTGGASPKAGSSRDDIGGAAADQDGLENGGGEGGIQQQVGGADAVSGGEQEEYDELVAEEVESELNSSLKPDHRFFAVRAVVEGGKQARKLNRRMKTAAAKDDGFLSKGDERFFRNSNDSSIERRVNVSASFLAHGKCNTCLNGPHDAWVGREGQPIVLAAGDHHYPPNLPAKGDGECIRILRVENGSLAEITDEVVRRSPMGGGLCQGPSSC